MDAHVELVRRAKEVLKENRLGRFTKPAPMLYPYQWNWDSGFIAMAYAHYDMSLAYDEMQSLFSAQWQNGMLPQIVFHQQSDLYFPGPDFWQTERSSESPSAVPSSGITMPPVHGFVLLHMLRKSRDLSMMKSFLKIMWPKLSALHDYLYTHRDPGQEALPYIRHPWEGGTDNSPLYDHVFSQLDLDHLEIPSYKRKDLKSSEAVHQRPHKKDYDLYIYLVDLFRKNNYDEQLINELCPFRIQDPLFIGILNYANEAMLELGEFLAIDTGQVREWHEATSRAMRSKLYNKAGWFDGYDLDSRRRIPVRTNSTLMPYLTFSQSEAERRQFERAYKEGFLKDGHYACPTLAFGEDAFESDRYWRGPLWLNMNFLLSLVMERSKLPDLALQLRKDSFECVERFGFFEYFDTDKSKAENGYGTDSFSWSAAMIIIQAETLNA